MAAIKKGEVTKVFDQFGKDLKKDSQNNLKKLGKGGGRLERRMFYVTKEFKNSFSFQFFMEDYAKFVDKGVKGVGGTRADGTPWRKKRVTNNLYSYKSKRPPTSVFDRWVIRKGLAPRSGGRFTSREGLKHALAKTVFHEGIEETNFLTTPLNKLLKELPKDIEEAYALDAERFFITSIKSN